MSYYRSFANLVSLLGVVTLGLVAAVVFFVSRMPAPAEGTPEAPAEEFSPPWAEVPDAADAPLDRASLERISHVPVPPARGSEPGNTDPVADGGSAVAEGPPETLVIDHAGLDLSVDVPRGIEGLDGEGAIVEHPRPDP